MRFFFSLQSAGQTRQTVVEPAAATPTEPEDQPKSEDAIVDPEAPAAAAEDDDDTKSDKHPNRPHKPKPSKEPAKPPPKPAKKPEHKPPPPPPKKVRFLFFCFK